MNTIDPATTIAGRLAAWAHALEPSATDLELASRSLLDTVGVALAAAEHPILPAARALSESAGAEADAALWATMAHVLDFDDLHMPSTTHISTVCVPVALATAGDDPDLAARAYLAGGGVMARLGTALGWPHYSSGWHATTTSGAPAAAVVAGIAMGLDVEQLTRAIALAVPAAGGVQRAFGTDCKSLQVGMAAAAGVRAARLAGAGAGADPRAVASWLELVRGDTEHSMLTDPASDPAAVPDGLAIKIYPACYALQRPISAVREALGRTVTAQEVTGIELTTPAGTVQPLVHHSPVTGLEGKFSLEYAAATALLDEHSGFAAFDDDAVSRPEAQDLIARTRIELTEGGVGLLDGAVQVRIETADGQVCTGSLDLPPGSPTRPPSSEDMHAKIADCLERGRRTGIAVEQISWTSGAALLRENLVGASA